MITARSRFHGHGSLKFLHKNADAYRSRFFVVKVIRNPHRKHSRFAVIVSKKTHKSAVGRNRIRRRVYEILRFEQASIAGVYDIAVIVTSGEVLQAEFSDLEVSLRELFAQAGVYRSRE